MKNDKLEKKVHVSETVSSNCRGRLVGRWKGMVRTWYMCERVATRGGELGQVGQGEMETLPLWPFPWDVLRGSEVLEFLTDRKTDR